MGLVTASKPMFLGLAEALWGPQNNKVGAWVRDPPLDPPMAEAVSLFCILYHVLLLYFTAI